MRAEFNGVKIQWTTKAHYEDSPLRRNRAVVMRSGREACGIGIAGPPDPGIGLWRSRLFAELASRDNSSPKALFVDRDQTAHGIGIARHPGPETIESLTELAS